MGRQAEALVPDPRRRPGARPGAFDFLGESTAVGKPVSLATVDAETMRDAIAAWTGLGHALTIGNTSDGGAVAVTLLAGGARKSKYFTDLALLEDFLVTLRDGASAQ
jgi:hypothetical protein